MQFRIPFVLAMSEQDPGLMRELQRSNQLDKFVDQKCQEAMLLYHQLTANGPKDKYGKPTMQADQEAQEIVRATLIEFPKKPDPSMLEPPNDLPPSAQMPTSKASISGSARRT